MRQLKIILLCLVLTTCSAMATTNVAPTEAVATGELANAQVIVATNTVSNEAAESTTASQAYQPSHIWRSLLALFVVLGGLYALNRYLQRRTVSFAKNSGRRTKVIERLYIDHKHSLLLVSVDNEEILLAVSPEQTNKVWEKKQHECNTTT